MNFFFSFKKNLGKKKNTFCKVPIENCISIWSSIISPSSLKSLIASKWVGLASWYTIWTKSPSTKEYSPPLPETLVAAPAGLKIYAP